MKKYKLFTIILVFLIIPVTLIGCSNNKSGGGNELVLTSLESKNAEELKATFENDKTVNITNFSPKPLDLGENTNVSFVYNGVNYSGDVKYTIDLTGNFNTNTSYIKKILSPTCYAQTNDQVAKVILFYSDSYKTAEVTNGSFELSIDKGAPAGLIFADSSDSFLGYLNVDGLDSLPINSLSDDTGSIDLGEISFSGIEGSPDSDNLLNIDPAEKEMLTATDDLFSSIVRNPDLNKNGKIDILEEEQIKTMINGKLMFYASGGAFNNDLTIDINESMNIGSSKFLVDFHSETYDIPNEIEFICDNTDINGKSSDSNVDENSGTYFSSPTSGILPADDYKVNIGTEITHTFTVSNTLSNAEDNLVYVIPKINLNEYGIISSIKWKFQNKNGDTIETPSNIVNSLEIQIDAVDANTAQNYKDYPQGEGRIYNGYPDNINSLEHTLTESIKWEDVGNINMAYNDVFRNHYVINFNNDTTIKTKAENKVNYLINAFENEDTTPMETMLAPNFEWYLGNDLQYSSRKAYITFLNDRFDEGATIENIDYKDLSISKESDSYVIIRGHWMEEGTNPDGSEANFDNTNIFHIKKIDGQWLITKLKSI